MIKAVEIVDSIQRKPEEYEIITFFSKEDVWEFNSVFDNHRCEACEAHEETGFFNGNVLRSAFPDLEIIDADLIRVNVHLNCRCYLIRVTERKKLRLEGEE